MEFGYTLSLEFTHPQQKKIIKHALKTLAGELEEYDREDFLDELSGFAENDQLAMGWDLNFPLCDYYYTDVVTDCLTLLAKAAPQHPFSGTFLIINYSSDGDRLVEYSYNGTLLSVNTLDVDSSQCSHS